MIVFLGFAHARKLGEENLRLFEPGVTGTSAELCESGLQLVHALKSKDRRIVFLSIFELAEIDPGKKKGEWKDSNLNKNSVVVSTIFHFRP